MRGRDRIKTDDGTGETPTVKEQEFRFLTKMTYLKPMTDIEFIRWWITESDTEIIWVEDSEDGFDSEIEKSDVLSAVERIEAKLKELEMVQEQDRLPSKSSLSCFETKEKSSCNTTSQME